MTSLLFAKKYIGGFEMIEISRLAELDKASNYPKEVQEKILEVAEIIVDDFREFTQFNLDFLIFNIKMA